MKSKILVILGPTAVGKSALAVQLAQTFNGEIISADSRQVYTGLDIGTGKITKEEMEGIPHHLLDIAPPSQRLSVMHWKESAAKAISEIQGRGKLPIITGGTGFYISALIDNLGFPEVVSDPAEQKELEAKSSEELIALLHALDPVRAEAMKSNNEHLNKRRVARSIIIARALGVVPPVSTSSESNSPYNALLIGITLPDEVLRTRIQDRLLKRLDAGMIDEVRGLITKGLTPDRLRELGLEYRYVSEHIQGHLSYDELVKVLTARIWHYARRQKTWFKRDTRIKWFEPGQIHEMVELIKNFI